MAGNAKRRVTGGGKLVAPSLFEAPGREPALERIRRAAARGTLSHAVLITGDGDRWEAARYTAAAFQCTGGGSPADDGMSAGTAAFQCTNETSKPCGRCEGCRKTARDIHPDIITVRDPDHKNIAVDIVRGIRADAWIRPGEGARKVYLFPDCTLLTEQDQNVLLKVVEEGPRYAAFVFCAESPVSVLQTIRSRCVELKLTGGAGAASAEPMAGQETGAELCRCVLDGGTALTEWAIRQESPGDAKKRISRDALGDALTWSYGAFAAALILLYGGRDSGAYGGTPRLLAGRLTRKQLVRAVEILDGCRRECAAYNIGPAHLLGALAADLAEIQSR